MIAWTAGFVDVISELNVDRRKRTAKVAESELLVYARSVEVEVVF